MCPLLLFGGPLGRALFVLKYQSPPPPFFPFPPFSSLIPCLKKPGLIKPVSSFNTMLSFEVEPIPHEFGFGSPPWDSLYPNPNENHPTRNSSGSDGPDPVDERRRRRMVSNRESARRSRIRKQRHLEGLRLQSTRLRSENRQLASRLAAVRHHCLFFRQDNHRLRSESAALHRRLSEIRSILLLRQIQRLSSAVCGGGPAFASGSAIAGSSIIA